MTASSLTPDLTPEALAARYSLLCRATCPPDADNPAQRELSALQNLIEQQLPALARHYCPPGFADTWLGLKAELQRLREFCACPALAHKTLIAFGGGFSAGKSSLINALIGEKRLLPAQVDPTTSLPTYLLHGPAHAIHALNQYRRLIELSPEEFASLTHDEQARFGSSAARLLEATYLTHPSFAWQNLAFIDTPGYSKPDDAHASRSDAQLARAWLNSAHAIVWAVSAEAGCISEDDLAFLATLNPDIPRVVVVTKADKKTEKDVTDIAELIKKTMVERNLLPRAVWATSARPDNEHQMGALLNWVESQDAMPSRPVKFAEALYALYGRYVQQINREKARLQELVKQQKKAAALSADPENASAMIESAQWHEVMLKRNTDLSQQLERLTEIIHKHLSATGKTLGIAVEHLVLQPPKGKMVLSKEDVPQYMMDLILEMMEKNLYHIRMINGAASVISANPEYKLKMEKFSQEIRNAINIYRSGGKAEFREDRDSSSKLLVIYDGKDLLAPAMQFFMSIYNEYGKKLERNFSSKSNYDLFLNTYDGVSANKYQRVELLFYYLAVQIEDPGFYDHLKNTLAAQQAAKKAAEEEAVKNGKGTDKIEPQVFAKAVSSALSTILANIPAVKR